MVGNNKSIFAGRNLADGGEFLAGSAHVNWPISYLYEYNPFYQWQSTGLTAAETSLMVLLPQPKPVSFFSLLGTNLSQSAQVAINHMGPVFYSDFTDPADWDISTLSNTSFSANGMTAASADTGFAITVLPSLAVEVAGWVDLEITDFVSGQLFLVGTGDYEIYDLAGTQIGPPLEVIGAGKHRIFFKLSTGTSAPPVTLNLFLQDFVGTIRSMRVTQQTATTGLLPAYPSLMPPDSKPMRTVRPDLALDQDEAEQHYRFFWHFDPGYPELSGVEFQISDPDNPEGFVAASRAFISQGIQFPRSVDHNYRPGFAKSKASDTEWNRKLDFRLSSLKSAHALGTLQRMIVDLGPDRDTVVIPRPSASDSHLDAYHGFLKATTIPRTAGRYSAALTITEDFHGR